MARTTSLHAWVLRGEAEVRDLRYGIDVNILHARLGERVHLYTVFQTCVNSRPVSRVTTFTTYLRTPLL